MSERAASTRFSNGSVNARFVSANEIARNRREPVGCVQRTTHQLIGRCDFVNKPERERFGWKNRVGAKHEAPEIWRRQSRLHDLEWQRREWHTNRQLGNPDAPRALGHHAVVAGSRDDAPARDGVAIDGRHGGLAKLENGAEERLHGGKETRQIRGAAVEHLKQVDACGERRSGAGYHERARRARSDGLDLPHERLTECDVEGAHLLVREANDCDITRIFANEHAFRISVSLQTTDANRAAPPAATVVVVRAATAGGFEVLLVRRNDKVAFMAGAYVFPGGRVDDEDLVLAGGDQALAFRVAAARELVEEANVRVDAADPILIAHWITPEIEIRRFDTRFFLVRMPDGQEARHDEGETTDLVWLSPADAIRPLCQSRNHAAAADLDDGQAAACGIARWMSSSTGRAVSRAFPPCSRGSSRTIKGDRF